MRETDNKQCLKFKQMLMLSDYDYVLKKLLQESLCNKHDWRIPDLSTFLSEHANWNTGDLAMLVIKTTWGPLKRIINS